MNRSRVDFTIPSLGGRAGVFQQRKIFQYQAQVASAGGVFQTPDRNMFKEGWMHDFVPQAPSDCDPLGVSCDADGHTFAEPAGLAPRRHKCERLWRVGSNAQVVYRSGAGPFTVLSPTEFDAFDVPGQATVAGGVTGGYGYFRLRVKATTLTGPHIFFMDFEQHVELYALQVQTDVVGPPNATLITQNNDAASQTPHTQTGLVVDARIAARMMPIEAPTGLRDVKLTQLVPVPVNTAVAIPVPRFAVAVKVYQDPAGAASGDWTRIVGPAAAPLAVGTLGWTGRATRDLDMKLGRESGLLTDTNAINDRLFQVIWTVRP